MANAIIRQEINILDSLLSAAGGASATSNEIVQLDTSQYNGATYYFEIVADSTISISFNVTLSGATDGTLATCNVPLLTTAYTLIRSASFTPTTATQNCTVVIDNTAGATKNVKAARIVIIQNAATITNTETQIEIGNASNTTTTTDTLLTNPKYWQYVAANWDGTKTFYFESTFMSGTSKSAATMTLQTSTAIDAPSWSNVASSGVTTTGTVATRVRSSAITLVDGNWYQAVMKAGNSKSGITTYNAKIIIDQGLTSTVTTYFFDGHTAISDPNTAWSSDSNAFDSSIVTAASTLVSGSVSSNYLDGQGTNAPTTSESIVQVRARIRGTAVNNASGAETMNAAIYTNGLGALLGTPFVSSPVTAYGNYVVLTVPSGGWTFTKINNLEVKIYGTTVTTWNNGDANIVELEVTYLAFATPPTKFESQYLLANTLFAAGTGIQTFLTKWDSTEWNDTQGGQPTFYFQSEAANGSTSDVTLEQADGGGTVTNSTLTNIDNAQISVAMTMPGNENLDTKATTNAGDVAAARILARYVLNSAPVVVVNPYTGNQFLQLTGVGI